MTRERGTFRFPFNYEREKEGNLDATKFVPKYEDLFSFTQLNYMYNGATVEVWDVNPELRGVYMLIDKTQLNNPNSWKKISIPHNFNEGFGLSITQVSATFSETDWVVDGTIYKLTYLDSNITDTSRVDVIPDNSTIDLVIAAEFLPQTISASGSVNVFAKNKPTNDIVVTLSILKQI
jgi:hypothetical protein